MAQDSAGVRILESNEAQWADTVGWQVTAEPSLAVGSPDGEEPYLFNRVSGAIILGNRNVAVADGGSRQIRLFDPSGVFIRSVGREGSGPGEFRDLNLLTSFGPDSVLVFDRTLQRATVLSSDLRGFRVMTLQVTSHPGVPVMQFALDDGVVVGRMNVLDLDGQSRGLWRDSLIVLAFDRNGSEPTVLFRAPGDDRYTETQDGRTINNNHPFGRRPEVATDGNRVFLADGSAVAVDVYSRNGQLQERWRAPVSTRPLDDASVERLKDVWKSLDASREWGREVERVFAKIALPAALPAVDAVVVDVLGHVWLKPYAIGKTDTLGWYVYTSEGAYLGQVSLPGTLRVTDIGVDYILGIGEGELGTEEVQKYTLRRS